MHWLGGAQFARLLNIGFDLPNQRIDIRKFLFRAHVLKESYLDFLPIDVLLEIEQMHFQGPLRRAFRHRGPNPKIHYSVVQNAVQPGFGEIDPIGRELFAVRAQVRRWKPELLSKFIAGGDSAHDAVGPPEHLGGPIEIALPNRVADRGAADHVPVRYHWRNTYNVKIKIGTEGFEQAQITRPVVAKRPFMSHADLAQRLAAFGELANELLRPGGGELEIELNHQEMADSKGADQVNLMLPRRQ